MALSFFVGQLTQPTSTGNQATTGVGFQPKAMIFWGNKLTADGSGGETRGFFGLATSSSARRQLTGYTPDLSTSQYAGHGSASCIAYINSGLGVDAEADFVSMDADGFTINWTTADATQRKVNYICLGGSDITNVKTGQFQEPASTGNAGVTGVGFQPDLIILPSFRKTSTAPPSIANSANRPGFSAGKSSTSRVSSATSNQNTGSAQFAKSYQRTNGIQASINATVGPAVESECDIVTMDSDGFTLNWSTVSANRYHHYLALKGGSFAVGSFSQATGTGNQATTGIGFQPTGIILFSDNLASSTSIQANARFSFGAGASSSQRYSTWQGVGDGGASSTANLNLDSANIIRMMTEGLLSTPTTQAVADLVSLDSDGFTLNWTTADATAREIMYIAFGNTPAGAVTVKGSRLLSLMGVGS